MKNSFENQNILKKALVTTTVLALGAAAALGVVKANKSGGAEGENIGLNTDAHVGSVDPTTTVEALPEPTPSTVKTTIKVTPTTTKPVEAKHAPEYKAETPNDFIGQEVNTSERQIVLEGINIHSGMTGENLGARPTEIQFAIFKGNKIYFVDDVEGDERNELAWVYNDERTRQGIMVDSVENGPQTLEQNPNIPMSEHEIVSFDGLYLKDKAGNEIGAAVSGGAYE